MTETTPPVPPVAAARPVTRTHHGEAFTDDFEWLRTKEDPEVITHLHAENAHTEAVTADQAGLRADIYAEIKAHTVETDQSVPARRDGWWYFVRTLEGQDYAVHCRVPAQDTGDAEADWTPPVVEPGVTLPGEQVVLDGNAEAEGHPFFSLGSLGISPDGALVAYAVDLTGDERYTLRVRRIATGEDLPDAVPDIAPDVRFDRTGTRVLYTVWDETWRPYQVRVHTLGTDPAQDAVLYEEADPGMWTGFSASADRTQLLIGVGNSEVSETWVLDLPEDAAAPLPAPRLLVPRTAGMLADVEPFDHEGERALLIVHDRAADGTPAPNGMLSFVREADVADRAAWRTVVAHAEDVKVDAVTVTATHAVLSVRRETTPRVVLAPLTGLPETLDWNEPAFEEELYTCQVASAPHASPFVRLTYTSWITPARVLDVVAATGEVRLRRQTEVPGFDPDAYVVERWWAPASEPSSLTGERVRIPLTVIRRRDVPRDGTAPGLVYGYGSYEMSMDPAFSVARLSLLDRGVVYVVAHVRGGGELGRRWYEDGKKQAKRHSFTDFVDATAFLADSGWVDPARIAAMGGSAGGLLMGAVANLAPQRYRAILAVVPFVDALTSILDPELPLSALEWEEWGNPIEDPEAYAAMKAYTPYENVQAVDYPAIAAVTSLNDTRVLYVEPAKWVAQLRRTVTGDQTAPLAEGGTPILLRTEMDGGHGGASGRYQGWEDTAWEYAFLLTALGATERVD
ncbi:S9 family peptidase [Micrococcus sp.]|uniref:S9 family peptidase n=1 Tax=Micrococcus sp. TaxID=1271 RepID=UPI002A908EFE|nr:S9 family peptidase [Micrococcus sp.]MDY6055213.1 S9 family peptidase [Micrococcus sp.]